jgi:hypothetical protein
VANNTINWTGDGFGIGYGIMVNGANDSGTPVEYAQGIIITGNTINGYGISNDDTAGAIVLQFTKDCVVRGNSIYRPTCNGICLNVYNYGVNVSGNVIIDPHDDDYATPSCIGVVGSYNSGFIGGNTCRYESDAHDTYVNIYSVMTKGSLSGLDLDIYHNSYAGAAVGHNAYNKGTSSGVRDT